MRTPNKQRDILETIWAPCLISGVLTILPSIKIEEKRRLMVEIRYLIQKSTSFKKKIFKKLKESEGSIIEPEILYKKLNKFTYNQLKTFLQDESKK